METRAETLAELAELVLAVDRPHPVRVAIDGCSAAGKTTLADELAQVLRDRTEREVVRVGIDYFKRAVVLRTAYPVDSPEGYYLDTWDNEAIRDRLLIPLGPGGDRRYTTAIMDPSAQNALDTPLAVAADDAVLLADGAFLQRPKLDTYWDLRIYVDITSTKYSAVASPATKPGWRRPRLPNAATARNTSLANACTSTRSSRRPGPSSS